MLFRSPPKKKEKEKGKHSPIRIPPKLLKLPPQLPQPNLLPGSRTHDDVPPIQLERVALVYELVQVLRARDGELGLVGTAHAREVGGAEG